jgi:hypothetical protein
MGEGGWNRFPPGKFCLQKYNKTQNDVVLLKILPKKPSFSYISPKGSIQMYYHAE